MSRLQTRQVCFAGNAISVTYHGTRLARLVDFLYRTAASDCSTPPHRRYRLAIEPGEGDDAPEQLTGYCEEALIYRGDRPAELADRLLGSSCHYLADRSRGGLLFHAAAAALNGRGLMMPGTMGAGKSTLTAWLLTRGFHYLSDELAFVPEGANRVESFPRPLNLKRPSRTALADFLDFSTPSPDILISSFTDLVQPTLLHPHTQVSQPPLALILFPNYQAEADILLQPLSKAQTGKALMECLINARNLPGQGFAEITRLARQTPAYRLTYSHFAQLGGTIEQLLAS